MKLPRLVAVVLAAAVPALILTGAATAKDKVRLVDSQAQIFVDFALYTAQTEGYYDAENLDVSIIIGRGGADSLQAVVTGSQDVVYGTGILGVVGAYAKGAPITIIANAVYGARDTFWYVRADSAIKTFKDLDGKDFAYSAPGSLTHLSAQTIARELGIKPKFIATGALAASRTQMMSGQIHTAWSAFPGNLNIVRSGEARIIGAADVSPTLSRISTRVVVANSNWLGKNRDVATRLLLALWKGQQYNFTNAAAITRYAGHWKIDIEDAKRVGEFYKLEDFNFAPLGNLDAVLDLAREYDFVKEPLSADAVKKMVDLLYDPRRG